MNDLPILLIAFMTIEIHVFSSLDTFQDHEDSRMTSLNAI